MKADEQKDTGLVLSGVLDTNEYEVVRGIVGHTTLNTTKVPVKKAIIVHRKIPQGFLHAFALAIGFTPSFTEKNVKLEDLLNQEEVTTIWEKAKI